MPDVLSVLVVADFEPFRQLVSSILTKRPEAYVIAEASNGKEAVQKAQKLQPDLILLDVGLLNGIEAALRMLKLAPTTKIIFVSRSALQSLRMKLSASAR
jgi:two-component system chemotaxis response regulator CheY